MWNRLNAAKESSRQGTFIIMDAFSQSWIHNSFQAEQLIMKALFALDGLSLINGQGFKNKTEHLSYNWTS